jgi:L-lactate dehydrogenase
MKVGIVGTGMVGATTGYAIVMKGVARVVVLVDINQARAQAEADDILHAVPFAYPVDVCAGDYADLVNCRMVILTAGVKQKPGETRIQLLGRNAAIFKQVVPSVLSVVPDALLLVATNPVDVMTHLTARYAAESGVLSSRILGSGTALDTARFRALLGRQLGIDSQHVHAYVLGEHGDSEVLNWSAVTVGGMPLESFCELRHARWCMEDWKSIDDQVRKAAYHIIAGKGATYYGIGSALARIVEIILRDQRSIITVCTPVSAIAGVEDVTVSLPNILGGSGILETLQPSLNDEETIALHDSAMTIKNAIDSL